jgi:hypothetical protein
MALPWKDFIKKDIDMLIETPYNMFRVISYLCGK